MFIIGALQRACQSSAPASCLLLVIYKELARVVHLHHIIVGDSRKACQSTAPASCLLLVIYKVLARVVHLHRVYYW